MSRSRAIGRNEIVALLTEVGELLMSRHTEASIYVVGGAAMSIEFDSRRTTHDIDAAVRSDRATFDDAAAEVGSRHGLPENWVNSTAVAFFTNEPDDDARELNIPGLRIAVASPEHLVAMKMRALRDRDIDDLIVLFRHLGITRPDQAVAIHDRLFDDSYIGYQGPDDAHYAAQLVFDRAAHKGAPLDTSISPTPSAGQSGEGPGH